MTAGIITLARLVKIAGRRWTIEENFQAGKGLTRLDQQQVRTWTSWHRWVTLAMLASAFLAVTTVAERAKTPALAGQIR
jgi:SRSO17 transposase